MPLTSRPYSVNTFALSKVWFRCSTVNLRESDFTTINSSIKRWLYADQLLKPEVIVLHRTVPEGGLGLISVKHKALACLLRNFTELAANPAYIGSLFLSSIYRAKVNGENIDCPEVPYYSQHFFDVLTTATQEGKDVVTMTTRYWYCYLIQRDVTVELPEADQPRQLKACRVERLQPNTDWPQIWCRTRP